MILPDALCRMQLRPLKFTPRLSKVPADMDPQTGAHDRRWLSDALLIAAVPAWLYALTLAYHLNFAGFFGVPFQVVSVSWTDVFVTVNILAGIAFVAALLTFFVSSFRSRSAETPAYQLAAHLLPFIIILAQSVYLFALDRHRKVVVIFLISAITGVLTSYFAKREHLKHIVLDPAGASRWSLAVIPLLWVYVGLSTAVVTGDAHARFQRVYYVVQSSPDTVVLGIWGDTLVTAPFDRSTRVVKRDLTISKITDHSPLAIRAERVGPLRADEVPGEK